MRLIDADKLFHEFEVSAWYNNADRDEVAEEILLNAPTIDAVPVVHGRWIGVYDTTHGVKYKLNNIHECSVCHDQFEFIVKSNHNYCPNCGAKMDGGE